MNSQIIEEMRASEAVVQNAFRIADASRQTREELRRRLMKLWASLGVALLGSIVTLIVLRSGLSSEDNKILAVFLFGGFVLAILLSFIGLVLSTSSAALSEHARSISLEGELAAATLTMQSAMAVWLDPEFLVNIRRRYEESAHETEETANKLSQRLMDEFCAALRRQGDDPIVVDELRHAVKGRRQKAGT